MTREEELEKELRHVLTLLDWGSLDGEQYQAYWRCKALVGTDSEKEWAKRKLGALWRCEDHSPATREMWNGKPSSRGWYNGEPFPGFSPYEGEMRDGPRRK